MNRRIFLSIIPTIPFVKIQVKVGDDKPLDKPSYEAYTIPVSRIPECFISGDSYLVSLTNTRTLQ